MVLTVERLSADVTPVLPTFLELTETVADESVSHVVVDVHSVDHDVLPAIKKDALWMQQGIRHLVDLLIVVMIDLATVTEHQRNVGNRKAQCVNRCSCVGVGASPETAHGVHKVVLEIPGVFGAMFSVVHAVVIERPLEEAVHERFIVEFVMSK